MKKHTVEPLNSLLSFVSVLVAHKSETPRLTSPSGKQKISIILINRIIDR